MFRVGDPRVFRADRKAFCRLWLDSALRHPGVRWAGVDLSTSTALIEFEPGGASPSTMASTFSESVREALVAPAEDATDRGDWIALTGFPGPDSMVWEVTGRSSNQLCFRPPALGASRDRRADWLDRMAGADGVTGCRSGWFSDGLTVAFDPSLTDEGRILDASRRAWLESGRHEPVTRSTLAGALAPAARGDRAANLAKAGGAFAMTLVGLAVPGIPTLPFLLTTSYYLARSSPRLNDALLNSAFIGPILREWEAHRGLSPSSKAKLIGLTAAILALTFVVTPVGPVFLIPMLLLSLVSFYAIIRLPGVQETRRQLSF
jgi:uncharacterized membrane protein YbaN (DUF454 family)